MNLRVVAQRLKMPDALDGVGDRFAVGDPPAVDGDLEIKALQDQRF